MDEVKSDVDIPLPTARSTPRAALAARAASPVSPEQVQEIEQVNEALQGCLDRLSRRGDPGAFLEHVIREATRVLQGAAAQVFLYSATSRTLSPSIGIDGDVLVVPAPGLMLGLPVGEPFAADAAAVWPRLLAARGPRWSDLERQPEEVWPGALGWHRSRGHVGTLDVALRLGDDPIGMLGIAFRSRAPLSRTELEFAQAIGHHTALAIQFTSLAAEAEQAAAARQSAIRLARANEALRQTIDALKRIDDLDDFVPAVLHIVARAFDGGACAVFEHREGMIFLRYWFMEGKVLQPRQILALDPDKWQLVQFLSEGFAVSSSYLDGAEHDNRTSAIVIDHGAGTSRADFDEFTRQLGWELEINAPIVVDGRAIGALTINRGRDHPFDPEELALAETLSAQLALAMEASRLSVRARERAVEVAVAFEQEKSARARSAELLQANYALRRAIEGLASIDSLEDFLADMLAEVMGIVGSCRGEVMLARGESAERVVMLADGRRVPREQWAHHGPTLGPLDDTRRAYLLGVREGGGVWALPAPRRPWPAPREAADALVRDLPLVVGERLLGWLHLVFGGSELPGGTTVELVRILAEQMTVAVEFSRLAVEAKQTAVALERERVAGEHAEQLGKANQALRRVNARLAEEPDLGGFLGRIVAEASAATGAPTGLAFVLDPTATQLVPVRGFEDGQIVTSLRDYPFHGQLPLPVREVLSWEALCRSRQPLMLSLDGSTPDRVADRVRSWHLARGHRWIVVAPMMLGSSPRGLLGLCSGADLPFSTDILELLAALAQQATLAVELTRLADDARATATLRAVIEERNRMAGEIHDSLAQSFTSIALQSESLLSELDPGSPVHTTLALIEETSRLGLAEARRSVLALRPLGDDPGELERALEQLAERCNITGSVTCEFRPLTPAGRLSPDVRDAILRVAQEAVSNALRHAGAQHLRIEFGRRDGEVCLTVTDDGRGIPGRLSSKRGGYGLEGMRARARALAGTLVVSAGPDAVGTAVRLTLACDARAEVSP